MFNDLKNEVADWLYTENAETTENIGGRLMRMPLQAAPDFLTDTALYTAAHVVQSGIEDVVVPASELFVGLKQDSVDSHVVPVLFFRGDTYQFTVTSFGQICEKSGMGVTAYMKKCLLSGLSNLVPENLNTWLRLQGDKLVLLRLYRGSVIAFLSSKYGVFDHGDALDCLDGALRNAGGRYRVEAHHMSIDNMMIRLVDTEKVVLTDKSYGRDTSTAGLVFRNGQTGRSLASIEFMIFTFACTNGLIVSQDRGVVYKQRHLNIDHAEFTGQILNALSVFPEYVEAARVDMERARNKRLSVEDHIRLRNRFEKDLNIGEQTVEDIFSLMSEQWDNNVWGLAGAVTEIAQNFSAERQYIMEKYAGNLLAQLAA